MNLIPLIYSKYLKFAIVFYDNLITTLLVPLQYSGTSHEFTASRQTVPLDTNYILKNAQKLMLYNKLHEMQ